MGKEWDGTGTWLTTQFWRECLRVLKPGGHAFVWALPRTSHWTGWAVESAGFEVRDCFTHIFGSGFPKSLDLSKVIDAAAGVDRTVTGYDAARARPNRLYEAGALGNIGRSGTASDRTDNGATLTAAASDAARRHDGTGSAVKPASEHWWLAQKPLAPVTSTQLRAATGWDWWYTARGHLANTPAERLKWRKRGIVVPPGHVEGRLVVSKRRALHAGVQGGVFVEWAPVRQDRDRVERPTLLGIADARAWREWSSSTIAANVLAHGTGGLQIDKCRVSPAGEAISNHARSAKAAVSRGVYGDSAEQETHQTAGQKLGRYPANLLLSHAPGCRRVGTDPVGSGERRSVRDGSAQPPAPVKEWNPHAMTRGGQTAPESYRQELVTIWECEDGCAVGVLDQQSGQLTSGKVKPGGFVGEVHESVALGRKRNQIREETIVGDTGGASRFFTQLEVPFIYQAKPSRSEREAGCEHLLGRADKNLYRLRADLTGEQVEQVLEQMETAGIPHASVMLLRKEIPDHLLAYFEPVEGGEGVGVRNFHPLDDSR
jgi:hypothetical protein